jgi:hypothetical protein
MSVIKHLDSYPNLAKEFHYKKNFPLKPRDFTFGSGKKIWWICIKGHEWKTSISLRTTGTRNVGQNCPFCSNHKVSRENNLKFLFPKIAKEWHPTKNNNLKPQDVTKSSSKKVWWICIKGHEWKAKIYNRKKGDNCPYCSGQKVSKENNLKVLFPRIAKEWHPTKNNNLKPQDVTKFSNKRVWWKCIKGHQWARCISDRTNGNNCPYCSGKKVSRDNNLKVLFPRIAKEWHPTKNNNLKPQYVTKSYSKRVWWKCANDHEWATVISNRVTGTNCPKCSIQSSKPEFRIISELETIFRKVDSRHKFKKIEVDIFIKDINVGIEYDGSYFHKNRRSKDKKKNYYLENYLKKLIRVRHEPLTKLNNFDVIVKKDDLKKSDLNNIFNSIYNFCNSEQKNLIKKYIKYKSFVNEKSYNKYLSYFPAPIPQKSLSSFNKKFVKEWNFEKNYPLKPESFSVHSNTKVWWICIKGHEWLATINNRSSGKQNCPYCSGQKVSKENNLKVLFPRIAKEWHPTKNGSLKSEDVTKSSSKKVWWLCLKGHEWKTSIGNRSRGTNCPECFNIKRRNFIK